MTAECPSCPAATGRVIVVHVQDVHRTVVSFRCPKCYRVWSHTIEDQVPSRFDVPRILPFRRERGVR